MRIWVLYIIGRASCRRIKFGFDDIACTPAWLVGDGDAPPQRVDITSAENIMSMARSGQVNIKQQSDYANLDGGVTLDKEGPGLELWSR